MIEVPEGYALVGIDALKAWGKYEQVHDACQVSMAPQASVVQQEPVAWIYTSKLAGNEKFMTRYASDLSTYKADQVTPLYTNPEPQRKPLTDEQIERGRQATFSTNNPFCPCDSKTMRKAVRWAEAAHGITKGQ